MHTVVDNNNAKKRVFPTLSVTSGLGRLGPSARVLFINTRKEVRVREIPTTKCRVINLPVGKLVEGLALRGLALPFGILGDIQVTSELVGRFGPSITVKINKCTDTPLL